MTGTYRKRNPSFDRFWTRRLCGSRMALISLLQDAYTQIDDLRRDYRALQSRRRNTLHTNLHPEPAVITPTGDYLGHNEMLARLAQTFPQANSYLRLRFNVQHYLHANPDLNSASIDGNLADPYCHWVIMGWQEGRSVAFRPDRLVAGEALAEPDSQ